jgi:hypothetical protein
MGSPEVQLHNHNDAGACEIIEWHSIATSVNNRFTSSSNIPIGIVSQEPVRASSWLFSMTSAIPRRKNIGFVRRVLGDGPDQEIITRRVT